MIATIIILGSLLILSCFLIGNLLKKVEKLEDIAESQTTFIDKMSETISYVNIKLNEIDDKGSFKADDEVGFFFETVKLMQDTLNQYTNANAQ